MPCPLCCYALPPSQIITKGCLRYWLRKGATISSVFDMDDMKLYAKSERDIDLLIHITRVYSNDINMSFRLDKAT